jgi:hypothetical protein
VALVPYTNAGGCSFDPVTATSTEQRYGADGDGALSDAEARANLSDSGIQPAQLARQELAVLFDLASRRIDAGTAIGGKLAGDLGTANVRGAVRCSIATLSLGSQRRQPRASVTPQRCWTASQQTRSSSTDLEPRGASNPRHLAATGPRRIHDERRGRHGHPVGDSCSVARSFTIKAMN